MLLDLFTVIGLSLFFLYTFNFTVGFLVRVFRFFMTKFFLILGEKGLSDAACNTGGILHIPRRYGLLTKNWKSSW